MTSAIGRYLFSLATAAILAARAADPNATDANGATALHEAALAGNLQAAQTLLEAGARVDARERRGATALNVAAERAQAEMAELLLRRGANVQNADRYGSTPLHNAAYSPHATEARLLQTIEALLKFNPNVNARGPGENTPLRAAIVKNRLSIAAALIRAGADVDAANNIGYTSLHDAVLNKNLAAVKLLLDAGADPNARAASGATPLSLARDGILLEISQMLSSKGARLDGLDPRDKVGPDFGLHRVQFTGNAAFSQESLRWALSKHPPYIIASHPMASRARLIKVIERSLQRGYLKHGFPDARVNASYFKATGNIIVTVEEGPRLRMSRLDIAAPENFPKSKLIKALASPQPFLPEFWRDAGKTIPRRPDSGELLGSEFVEDPWWSPGAACDFLQRRNLTNAIWQELVILGYGSASFQVQTTRNAADNTLDLAIAIAEPNETSLLETFTVSGNVTNSAEAIQKFLKLDLPMKWAGVRDLEIPQRLWQSGRFHDFDLGLFVAENKPPGISLLCEESALLPPLAATLTREQEALLKFAAWIAEALDRGIDFIATADLRRPSLPQPVTLQATLSARGLAVAELNADGKAPLTLAMTGEELLAEHNGARVIDLDLSGSSQRFYAGALLLPDSAAPGRNSRFSYFGAGTAGRRPGEPIFMSRLLFSPATLLEVFAPSACALSWSNSVLACAGTNGLTLKIDGETGELIDLSGSFGEILPRISVRAAKGAFAALAEKIVALPAAQPSATGTATAFARLWLLLQENSALARDLVPAALGPVQPQHAAIARKLVDNGALKALDEIVTPILGLNLTNRFFPETDESGAAAIATNPDITIRNLCSELARAIFPAGSWPIVVTREVANLAAGHSVYAEEAMRSLMDSGDIGPLSCLFMANHMLRPGIYGADTYAQKGLQRLSLDLLQKDLRFFAESPLLQKILADTRASFAKLSADEQTVILRDLPAGLGANLFGPAAESDDRWLAKFWESSFKEQLRAALTSIVTKAEERLSPEIAFARASRAMSGEDKAGVLKWLRIAAERGHSEAALHWGEWLEKGLNGVPRDLKEAARFYETAAIAGDAQAPMRLASLLSDALGDSQDYPAAFVWFTVAEFYGNRVAGAFKAGVKRKLSPEQIADAETKARQIVLAIDERNMAAPR